MKKGIDISLLSTKIHSFADKLWKVALFGPDNYRAAVISHYVKSRKKQLKTPALNFSKELINGYWAEDGLENITSEEALQYLIKFNDDIPFPGPKKPKFTFIDLFAGVGGFRLAMQNLGGECVFSSEWDKEAQKTYYANFGEIPFGDITKEETKKWIPKSFDILCAGFPCQAFSIAGKRGGFNDTRGTLFYDVAEIIKRHKPKAVFLENVKGLANHDKGRTLATILNVLREDLQYYVPEPEIVNAKYFGVPQNRERVYIVGFRSDMNVKDFLYPEQNEITAAVEDIIEEKVVDAKYYMSTQYLKTLVEHKARHESKGNGFGYEILKKDGVANAIVVGGMGRERNLVIDKRLKNFTPTTKIKGEVNREGVRRLTPREWARLQGFPDHYVIDKVADASAYKQFGNSVAVPAIQATAELIIEKIQKHLK
jgi:DNA (cytosine-5)-methyltransferase 1